MTQNIEMIKELISQGKRECLIKLYKSLKHDPFYEVHRNEYDKQQIEIIENFLNDSKNMVDVNKLYKDFCKKRFELETKGTVYSRLNWTKAAELIGVHRKTLWQVLVAGEQPSQGTLQKISAWVGEPIDKYIK